MPLSVLKYIAKSGVVGAPITYKWDSDIGLEFYAGQEMNLKMYKAIEAVNFKARMASAVAITEWIVWRLEGRTDLTDALHRVEAAWASAIDPDYVNDLSLEVTKDDDVAPVEGPLELALSLLGEFDAMYANGDNNLAGRIVNQALLARYLMPAKKTFSDWLSSSLRRAADVFPRPADYDEEAETYDYSEEEPVPREFFDPGFAYTKEAAEAALRTFLQTLDPKQNPYLRTPKEMKAEGFKGTPYTL